MLIKDTCELAAQIMAGDHDEHLGYIAEACKARLKNTFRKGMKVTLTGTKNVALDGKTATIVKVNQKSISVGVGDPVIEHGFTYYPEGEYNCPPSMLKAVGA